MRKNVLNLTLALLVIVVCSSLFADELTRPIQEGDVVIAPQPSVINVDREIKRNDFNRDNYSRRPEIFTMAYNQLYLDAVTRFPNENLDVRDVKVTWSKAERDKTTTFIANGQVVRLPEGHFSHARQLTRPLLEEERPFISGAVSTNFTFPRKTTQRVILQDEEAYEFAYSRLLREAQASFDARADVRAISLKLSNEDHIEATGTVIIPEE